MREEKKEKEKLYSTGEVCRLMHISRKTLFYYDRVNLLSPTMRSGLQNVKLYDEAQLQRLKEILSFRTAGLSISEIRNLLDAGKEERKSILEQALAREQKELEEKKKQICFLESLIHALY